jgi:SAM-dependent methyltransferase
MSKHAYAVLQRLNAKGVAMVTSETLMHEYYEKVINFPHRPLLEWAATLNQSSIQTAIDCGCGTGSDSAYLAQLGYKVHCFDINSKSIEICRKRFSTQPNISVLESSFESFRYPKAGLVVAHSSLFFCDPAALSDSWWMISKSIQSGGVCCGDFMGLNDSWAENSNHTITALSEAQISSLLKPFEILKFTERDEAGRTAVGKSKHWHTYTVVARKCI